MLNLSLINRLKIRHLFHQLLIIASSILLVVLVNSCSNQKDAGDDTKIIFSLLEQLEKKNYLHTVIETPPPPRVTIEDFSNLSARQIDSAFAANDIRLVETQRKEELSRELLIIIPVSDTFISSCNFCSIINKNYLDQTEIEVYEELLSELRFEKRSSLRINLSQLPENTNYQFKLASDFADEEEIYTPSTTFRKGGLMHFSRVYQKGNFGMFYYEYYRCQEGCGVGFLVLLEKKEGRWKIKSNQRQWIE